MKEELKLLAPSYKSLGCVYEVQNPRKIYLTPKEIEKGASIVYLKSKIGKHSFSISAGDSELDRSMFNHTDTYICPNDHTIKSIGNPVVTVASGIDAGEEILDYVLGEVKDIGR